jgi:putative hydrolase of the HAD superfamily
MKKEGPTNRSQIKAVIFDVGGVLALGKDLGQINGRTKGVHEAITKQLGISLDQWFDTIGLLYDSTITGKVSENEFLSYLEKTFQQPKAYFRNLFLESYKSNFKINKELYSFAFKLKKKGYRIAILSDQHQISKEVVMPKSKIKHFNPVIVSCDVGVRKPNPKIYILILKQLKLKPQQTVFIDNQSWNLVPAKKLGMHTILFKTNKQLFKQLEKIGVIL